MQWTSSFVFLPLRSPPIHQQPVLANLSATALIENPSSSEFFVLRRFFHFSSTSSTKIIHKKINNPYNGISCSWTSCSGIQLSVKCRTVTMSRVILFPSSRTRLCRVQNVTTSISSRVNHAITTQCLVKNVPPSVEEHHSCHMQVSSIMQQCEEDGLLLLAIDTQHHDSHHWTVREGKLS